MNVIRRFLEQPTQDQYNDLNFNRLSIDEAFCTINTSLPNVGLYGVKEYCYKCPFKLLNNPYYRSEKTLVADTSSQYIWRVMTKISEQIEYDDKSGLLCETRPSMGEFGVYVLDVGRCNVEEVSPPVNIYLPLLLCFIGVLFIFFIGWLFKRLCLTKRSETLNTSESYVFGEESLNTLQCLSAIAIVFLQSGAGGYFWLRTSIYGATVSDVLFGIYVWSVGAKLPLFVEGYLHSEISKAKIIVDVAKRFLLLISVGFSFESINSGYAQNNIWAPLQRLGLSYLIAGCLYVLIAGKHTSKWFKHDVSSLVWCCLGIGVISSLQFISILAVFWFNSQNTVNPRFGSSLSNGNEVSYYINRYLIRQERLYFYIGDYLAFNEGVIGCVTSTLQCLNGLLYYMIYKKFKDVKRKRMFILLLLLTITAVGAGVCYKLATEGFPMYNLKPFCFPFFTSILSVALLYCCYRTIHFCKIDLTPILGVASNSILLLVLPKLFARAYPFHLGIGTRSHLSFLLESIWTTSVWIGVALFLAAKKISLSL